MDTKKNRLKEVLEGVNADTKALKSELKKKGIPPTTLWKYINQPDMDIKGSHLAIISEVTGVPISDIIVANANNTPAVKFGLTKQKA